jgi:hypothetical protein
LSISPIESLLDFRKRDAQSGVPVKGIKPVEPMFSVGIERASKIEKDGFALKKFLGIPKRDMNLRVHIFSLLARILDKKL